MSAKRRDNAPAFPSGERFVISDAMGDREQSKGPLHEGLTLRQWFAGQALAGVSTRSDLEHWEMAEFARKIADSMIKEIL